MNEGSVVSLAEPDSKLGWMKQDQAKSMVSAFFELDATIPFA
jgi:hypothetical protein